MSFIPQLRMTMLLTLLEGVSTIDHAKVLGVVAVHLSDDEKRFKIVASDRKSKTDGYNLRTLFMGF